MKNLFFFLFLTVFLNSQNNSLFIDGVAAVVEDKIVLKSDLNQMVNMMAIQQNINPNENINRFIKLKSFVLESMIDQKILLEMAEEDTTIEFSEILKEISFIICLSSKNLTRFETFITKLFTSLKFDLNLISLTIYFFLYIIIREKFYN